VPDPYYKGPAGFEEVLDILEDSCKVLLEKIKDDLDKQ
jgi:protein-tyrosine phosphatase